MGLMPVSHPTPRSSFAFRLFRPKLIVAFVITAFVAWIASLGWPSATRVSARLTPFASVESSDWMQSGPDLMTRSARVYGASGLAVNVRVLRPDRPDADTLPVIVLLGGHRTGRDAIDLIGHPGGLTIVALDYPYEGPDRLRGVRQISSSLRPIRRALLDTPAAVSLALDWVLAEPWANPNRIELVGVSLGTQFAAAAGVLDPRFQRIWFVQGAGDSRRWLVHQLEDRIAFAPLRVAIASMIWWIAHGPSLQPNEWIARIAPRAVVVVGARNDLRLPPELVTALHDVARAPRRLAWTEGGHINPRQADSVRPLLDLIQPEVE